MERAEIVRQLRSAPVLRQLPQGALDTLLSHSEPREFPPGAVLLEEGGAADQLFVLMRGRVAIRLRIGENEDCFLAMREACDWVGEMAIADDRPRSASVVADGPVVAFSISRDAFLESVGRCPAAALDLVRVVTRRLRESDKARLAALKEANLALSCSNRALHAENLRLRSETESTAIGGFLGSSQPAERVRTAASRAAETDLPVLILGETGTGKELVARAIHEGGAGRSRPFVALNCALLSESLLHSELFGYARGAFTGAVEAKPGLVEAGNGATLFLDEVADAPLRVQAALLRFLELGEFRRLGETRVRFASVRVVAATNVEVEAAVAAGSLRRDLLYRLDVFRIEIPPIRERSEDLPMLLSAFSSRVADRLGRRPLRFGADALDRLSTYAFPGNVRELQNEIERLYATLGAGGVVEKADLSSRIVAAPQLGGSGRSYREQLRSFKVDVVEGALERAGGNRTVAARALGVHRANLVRMIRNLGIDTPDPGGGNSAFA